MQRAPRPNPIKEQIPGTSIDALQVLWAADHDKQINRKANYLDYKDRYAAQGEDLAGYYAQAAKVAPVESGEDAFFKKKKMNELSQSLVETLPLYANSKGRLGDSLDANVTKTAKPDDEGNSRIDFVIELNNKWLATVAPKEFHDIPARMTFLIEVKVQDDKQLLDESDALFRRNLLDVGAMANVKCYETKLGKLGVEKPKIIVYQDKEQITETGQRLGPCIVKLAGDKFSINAPEKFDKAYREYFRGLMEAIAENAESNIVYLKGVKPDGKEKERAALMAEYVKIVKFVEAYKKTPVT
jgi:hypothetical protein